MDFFQISGPEFWMEFQGLKFQRKSAFNPENKGFCWRFQALKGGGFQGLTFGYSIHHQSMPHLLPPESKPSPHAGFGSWLCFSEVAMFSADLPDDSKMLVSLGKLSKTQKAHQMNLRLKRFDVARLEPFRKQSKPTWPILRDRKGAPKNFCDKDFAELPGELSGAICLETLALLGSALELFRNSLVLFAQFFGFGVLFWRLI